MQFLDSCQILRISQVILQIHLCIHSHKQTFPEFLLCIWHMLAQGSQSVVPGPATLELLENLLEQSWTLHQTH